MHIENILDSLLENFTLVHQTGADEEYGDYDRLVKKARSNYIVRKHIEESEIGFLYNKCDFVISRAGANTIWELIAIKKPSILVPLPWSGQGEQWANAGFLMSNRVAETFDQKEKSDVLLNLVESVSLNLNKYKKNFANLSNYKTYGVAEKIVKEILSEI